MIRTLKFALRHDPGTSQAIAYHATQQNLAYNHAVDVLNREPRPVQAQRQEPSRRPQQAHHRSGGRLTGKKPTHPTTSTRKAASRLGKPISDCRKLVRHDSNASPMPWPVAIAPKHRDIQHHRRTLAHRTRKQSRLSLTITDRRLLAVSDDGQTLASRQCGFTVRLRGHQNLKWLDIRSIRLVPVKDYGARVPLHRRHYCLHAQVSVPKPTPIAELDIQSPEDIIGADRGAKNHLAVSSGHRAHHQGSGATP